MLRKGEFLSQLFPVRGGGRGATEAWAELAAVREGAWEAREAPAAGAVRSTCHRGPLQCSRWSGTRSYQEPASIGEEEGGGGGGEVR